MIEDISFVYSDSSNLDDPMQAVYVNRDSVARWYYTTPAEVEKMDAIEFNFGLFCMQAQGMAKERLHFRQKMQAEMRK